MSSLIVCSKVGASNGGFRLTRDGAVVAFGAGEAWRHSCANSLFIEAPRLDRSSSYPFEVSVSASNQAPPKS